MCLHPHTIITLTTLFLLSLFAVSLSASDQTKDTRSTAASSQSEVDPRRCVVSGPGLNASGLVLPVRYVVVQAVDSWGNFFNHSPEQPFVARLSGESPSGSACRHRIEVLDIHDGRSIVRFRPISTCFRARLEIFYANRPVADSPYQFSGALQPEECHCPIGTLSDWIDTAGCPQLPQMQQQMERYSPINLDAVLNRSVSHFNRAYSQSFCNYVVLNNEVYRKCYGKYQGFSMFVDALLHSLRRKSRLPDTEFLFNLGDWPLVTSGSNLNIPMFSWCGSNDTDDLVVPTYDLTGSTLDAMQRVTLDMLSVQSVDWLSWHSRNATAFWRGRDSCRQRLRLVELSRQHPQLIDAAITHFFFFKDEIDRYGPTQERVSFFQFFNYKYQISVDGTVAAYRLPYLLAGGSLVFKQKSKYYEHFYRHLVAGQHYIEVENDLSDLVDKLRWAQQHDDQARKIAEAGRRLAQQLLLPRSVLCYHATVLQLWSQMPTAAAAAAAGGGGVRRRPDMQLVEDETHAHRLGECRCDDGEQTTVHHQEL